jgi:hypothetical protein
MKIGWLMLFMGVITVYSEKQTKPINTFRGQSAELVIIEASGTYGFHWALKCLLPTAS